MIRGNQKSFGLIFYSQFLYQHSSKVTPNSPQIRPRFGLDLQRSPLRDMTPMEYSKNSDMEYSKPPVKPSDMDPQWFKKPN